jgi:hypothetical protein
MDINTFVHIANVGYLASYLVRDIFILRILTVVAGLLLLPFYFFQGADPLWTPIIWSFVFTAVNVYQLIALFIERRPVVLADEDYKTYKMSFANFTVKQFAKMLKISKREAPEAGSRVLQENTPTGRVMVVIDGEASIEKNGTTGEKLVKGSFIGEIAYITLKPPRYCVNAEENLKLIYWDKESLEKLMKSDPELRACWQSLLSSKLAERLNLN